MSAKVLTRDWLMALSVPTTWQPNLATLLPLTEDLLPLCAVRLHRSCSTTWDLFFNDMQVHSGTFRGRVAPFMAAFNVSPCPLICAPAPA